MKIGLLQINPTVGDLGGNARLIAEALREAGSRGADLAITPELGVVGYLPGGLLLGPAVVAGECDRAHPAGPRHGSPAAGARRPAGTEPLGRRTAALQQRGAAPRRRIAAAGSQGADADVQ